MASHQAERDGDGNRYSYLGSHPKGNVQNSVTVFERELTRCSRSRVTVRCDGITGYLGIGWCLTVGSDASVSPSEGYKYTSDS